MLVVVSKIKKMSAAVDLRASKDFIECLDKKVQKLLIESAKSAKESNRKTIKPQDIPE